MAAIAAEQTKPESRNAIHNDNDIDDENNDEGTIQQESGGGDASAEAAAGGVVRGAARSIGRSVARSPIGSLPKARPPPPSSLLNRRLPVRQVARVSDRISTGYEWWSLAAVDDSSASEARKSGWPRRIASFGFNLFKNTLLGLAVFESYGAIVSHLAPAPIEKDEKDKKVVILDGEGDGEVEPTKVYFDTDDDYTRASIPVHALAGFSAGSVHGIATSIMESAPQTTGEISSSSQLRRLMVARNTFHHAAAHSLLFSSYEGFKRLFVSQLEDHEFYGGGYLLAFGVAGGLAGQAQHVVSHYMEPWAMGIPPPPANGTNKWTATRLWSSAPTLRPTLAAFLPSAIGFVAFEYGKQFST